LATESRAETVREPRFPLVVPLEYRHAFQLEWHEGTTVNVSGTGALFTGPQSLWLGAPIELRLKLDGAAPGLVPENFRSTGRITRIASGATEAAGAMAMMAAQFEDFRFEQPLMVD
jgi:hypothetical protein